MIALKLAAAGFFGGDPEKVMSARVDWVINALDYNHFKNEFERVYYVINKPKKR